MRIAGLALCAACGPGHSTDSTSTSSGGPADTTVQVDLYPYLECALDPWLGAHALDGTSPDDTPFATILTIDSYSGDWISEDPVDPPRLFGNFSGDLVGPFEPVHCAALDIYSNCG